MLRHAKSSWDEPAQADHDRPLKKRGIKAAGQMGRLLRDKGLRPERVLCSTAVRARETLRLVLLESGLQPDVEYSERIYHCSPSDFVVALQNVRGAIQQVMLVGHNPGMEEFLFQLTGRNEAFPTAALARLNIDLSDWSEFSDDTRGRLIDLWRPKELE
jgi:phosphohistidine phosphatase